MAVGPRKSGGRGGAARVVTHPRLRQRFSQVLCDTKGKQKAWLTPAHPPQISPPPISQMGRQAGGKGEGGKGADCAKENKRDRETSRDRKHRETERIGG